MESYWVFFRSVMLYYCALLLHACLIVEDEAVSVTPTHGCPTEPSYAFLRLRFLTTAQADKKRKEKTITPSKSNQLLEEVLMRSDDRYMCQQKSLPPVSADRERTHT